MTTLITSVQMNRDDITILGIYSEYIILKAKSYKFNIFVCL